MKLLSYRAQGRDGLALNCPDGVWRGRLEGDPGYPGRLEELVSTVPEALRATLRSLEHGVPLVPESLRHRPPIASPGKIVCVGLNYIEHTKEVEFKQPDYPTLFTRFASTLLGAEDPLVRPAVSEHFDYEGELAAIIGRGGRRIPQERALEHIAGWSCFNDVSVRDYQFRTSQWTVGKNFDGTGAFGPWFVTPDELPPGARGLKLETRLNGVVVQSASTSDMIFDVATLIALISEVMTLMPGDIIVTGTPSGVGYARKPPLWMKPGDVIEVEIERVGTLRNRVVAE